MSKAEELLDSLSIEDIQPFTSQPDIEGHIVIDKDRIIHVPTELKRIAVQYDANIETVTFDCPRYWDEHDLSEMNIYINYKLPGNLINNVGQSLAKNLRINEDDENIINFDWTIGPILTNNKGNLPFSVCAKSKTNQDSDEAIRWYTEINTELTISEGMDGSGDIEDNYQDMFPDIINDIISKLDGINATYDEKLDAFNANATSKTESFDTNAETRTTEFNDNAAQKTLDYNNNCTSKTDSFNQNSTQKVTEFNDNYTSKLNSFNSNADLRTEEFNENADLVLSSIPKNNAEGTDNTFDDGLESPLYALGGDGKSEQVVTQGYNSLPNNLSSQNVNGINITKNDDGSITLNGTATKGTSLVIADLTNFSLQGTYNFYLIGKNDKINLQGIEDGETVAYLPFSHNTNDYITKEYETAKNLTRIFSYIGSGTTFNNETFKYMITQGSDVKNYEPYTGGQPSPSPDYPQEINSIEGSVEFACRGKNWLPYPFEETTKTENGITFTDNGDGTITVNGTATAGTCFKVFATQTNQKKIPGNYISGSVTDCNVIVAHREGSKYTSLGISTNGNSSLINKELYDIGYVELSILQGATFNNVIIKPMLSNEQNVDWEPYIEPNQVTFNLGQEKLRSVGDVKDELVVDLDTGDYYKVENIGEVVLDGSIDFKPTDNVVNKYGNVIFVNYEILKRKPGVTPYTKYPSVISNYFKEKEGNIWIGDKIGIDVDEYRIIFVVSQTLATTLEEFKAWLQQHNVVVDYRLANSQTVPLGTLPPEDLAKLKTFKGYNNVTVNTNLGLMNIRFTYGLDIKKYIDNKIAELSAQLIKGE